jgi:hypothetical protein
MSSPQLIPVEVRREFAARPLGERLTSVRDFVFLHWIGLGAELSDSVYNLLVREGVVVADKKRVIKMKRPLVKVATAETAPTGDASVSVESEEKAA